ncbi:MAG TPA: hypothetical protein VKV77_02170 [Methylovirgula sp.]|nr:hypothetical protein [Methylovirgula sp.]
MADKPEDRAKKAKARTRAKKSAKKPQKAAPKKAKAAVKRAVAKKAPTRKPVPIKKARVGKRAILPRLPPLATVLSNPARSPVRRASRVKALLRNKGAIKRNPAVHEIVVCSEAVLREKLRLAAPYLALWLARRKEAEADAAEAAFVRIWQWLTLEATLDDQRVVTPDLIGALFAEETGMAP